MNIAQCILYILAGLGAGVVTGLAGLSAAVVILLQRILVRVRRFELPAS